MLSEARKIAAAKLSIGLLLLWFVVLFVGIDFAVGNFQKNINSFGLDFWILYCTPKFVPIMFAGVYLIYSINQPKKKLFDTFATVSVISVLAVLAYSEVYFLLSTSLLLPSFYFPWHIAAIIEYSVALVLAFILFLRKFPAQRFAALTFSVLSVSAIGLVYELPILYNLPLNSYLFDSPYPLYVSTSLVSLLFFAVWIVGLKWKPEKYFTVASILFVVYAVIYAATRFDEIVGLAQLTAWVPRLVGTVFLLSFVPGIKGVTIKNDNHTS